MSTATATGRLWGYAVCTDHDKSPVVVADVVFILQALAKAVITTRPHMHHHRSRLSMTNLVEKIGSAIHDVKHNAHDYAQVKKSLAEEKLLDVPYVDLTIQV